MNWLRELKLRWDPFAVPIDQAEQVYQSQDVRRIQDAIVVAVHQRQMLFVLGPTGSGKTTIVQDFLGKSSDVNHKPVTVMFGSQLEIESMDITRIVRALIRQLLKVTGDTAKIKNSADEREHQLRALVGEYTKTHELVLVLEDGHNISPKTLINLKLLREMRWTNRERLITIIIIAQPKMRNVLDDVVEVTIRSAITEMQGLAGEEVREYIAHKLDPVGKTPEELFTKESLQAIQMGLRFPQHIDWNLSRMLQEGVELGMIPVPIELTEKYVAAQTTIRSLMMQTGVNITDIQNELRKLGQKADRHQVRDAVEGRTPNSPLVPMIREIVLKNGTALAALYNTIAPGLTKDQLDILEECVAFQLEMGDYLDYSVLSRETGFTQRRIIELMDGINVTTNELKRLHTVLSKLVQIKNRKLEKRVA